MTIDIEAEVARLEQMPVGELRDEYAERCGEMTSSRHRKYLIRKIAIRSSLLWSALAAIRNEPGPFIDRTLWDQVAAGSRQRLERSCRVIGMKGVRGRVGLGLGHAEHHFGSSDPDRTTLERWMGRDADLFFRRT